MKSLHNRKACLDLTDLQRKNNIVRQTKDFWSYLGKLPIRIISMGTIVRTRLLDLFSLLGGVSGGLVGSRL